MEKKITKLKKETDPNKNIKNLDEDKEKEIQNIKELLELPKEAFTPGDLDLLEPEEWKNVGMSIIQAVRILKDHQMETDQNLTRIKLFLDKFSYKSFTFMKQSELEIDSFKKKVTKEFNMLEKSVDEKLRSVKISADDNLLGISDSFNKQWDKFQQKMLNLNEKVDACEPAEKIIEKIRKIYDSPLAQIKTEAIRIQKELESKIVSIYKEELWEANLIGPMIGAPCRNLKTYIFQNIQRLEQITENISLDSKQRFLDLQLVQQNMHVFINHDLVPRVATLQCSEPFLSKRIDDNCTEILSLKTVTSNHLSHLDKLFVIVDQEKALPVKQSVIQRTNNSLLQLQQQLEQQILRNANEQANELGMLRDKLTRDKSTAEQLKSERNKQKIIEKELQMEEIKSMIQQQVRGGELKMQTMSKLKQGMKNIFQKPSPIISNKISKPTTPKEPMQETVAVQTTHIELKQVAIQTINPPVDVQKIVLPVKVEIIETVPQIIVKEEERQQTPDIVKVEELPKALEQILEIPLLLMPPVTPLMIQTLESEIVYHEVVDDEPIIDEKPDVALYQKTFSEQKSPVKINKSSQLLFQMKHSPVSSDQNSDDGEIDEQFSDLRSKFKKLKLKFELLQTQTMQQYILSKQFENNVAVNFKRIKIDILEQIVRSKVIHELLQVQKSPSKQDIVQQNTPTLKKTTYWETSASQKSLNENATDHALSKKSPIRKEQLNLQQNSSTASIDLLQKSDGILVVKPLQVRHESLNSLNAKKVVK